MALPSPDLDDRSFEDLRQEALQRVKASCPEWTDLSASDPGVVLLEAFAYLTDVMLYRLNRVPSKAYVEFLRLIGTRLFPPTAASTQLRFHIEQPRASAVLVPELTRVTMGHAAGDRPTPVFITATSTVIAPGETDAAVLAYHVDLVEAELAGVGTGEPAQWVRLKNAPVVAAIPEFEELIVAVETPRSGERFDAREHAGKVYRVWREVDSFAQVLGDRHVYTIDRASGIVTFAPAVRLTPAGEGLAAEATAMGEYPAPGREIRVWYCSGGGPDGNLAAGTLTVLKDAIPGVGVTHPVPATGGAAGETVENALLRGPQQLHSLERAVTARDFEMFAERNAGAVRAKAFTQAELWAHATPGTVEVLLVPAPPDGPQAAVAGSMADRLRASESDVVLEQVRAQLQDIKPVGTRCDVGWVQYKSAYVQASIVVYRSESPDAVKQRVLASLNETINPLPTRRSPGWRFGEPLRASHIYDSILSQAGVSYVDRIRLMLDDVPDKDVVAVAGDRFQRNTWHAACGNAMFRSMNDGESWERTSTFEWKPGIVRVHPDRPGVLAVVSLAGDGSSSRVHVSRDCAETWQAHALTQFDSAVKDLAWIDRDDASLLLVATDKGLWEVNPEAANGVPIQVLVGKESADLGMYCVSVFRDARGTSCAAVGAQRSKGIFLSREGAQQGSFNPIGLAGEDVRTLAVQALGPRTFLWAGLAVPGNEPGKGCFRWEVLLDADQGAPRPWDRFGTGWIGGSCYAMAFIEARLLAATHHSGIVGLDTRSTEAAWEAPSISCGLPTRESSRDAKQIFQPLHGLATSPAADMAFASGPVGIFRSADGGKSWEATSRREFAERVALPANWLFCSGDHQIEVRREDEAD